MIADVKWRNKPLRSANGGMTNENQRYEMMI